MTIISKSKNLLFSGIFSAITLSSLVAKPILSGQTFTPTKFLVKFYSLGLSNKDRSKLFKVFDNSEGVEVDLSKSGSISNLASGVKPVEGSYTHIYGVVSNTNTIETISYYKEKYDYLSDPHTATGLSILKNVDPDHPYISLACAHPAKFNDAVEKATGSKSLVPKELENIFDKKEKMTILNNETKAVKSLILKNL